MEKAEIFMRDFFDVMNIVDPDFNTKFESLTEVHKMKAIDIGAKMMAKGWRND